METITKDTFVEGSVSAFEQMKLKGMWDNQSLAIREKAFHHFLETGLPTMKDEEWKHTSIKKAFKSAYTSDITPSLPKGFRLTDLPENAIQLVYLNGGFQAALSNNRSVQGLHIVPDSTDHLSKSSQTKGDGLQALHTAFSVGGSDIVINEQIEPTIYIVHLISQSSSPFFQTTHIKVGRYASANIEEVVINTGDGYAVGNIKTTISIGENANLHYIKHQDIQEEKYLIDNTMVTVDRASSFHIYTCTFSGEIVRNNLEIILQGESSEAHLHGLYLLKNSTHCDNHTLVDHAVPNCYSNELYKGIIGDTASGVFNGKIIVRPDAQKTNAFQSNRNILTSDGANIYTKPQLEIFADDVKCSHGATSSRLDATETFYLQSRGISKQHAEAMLMKAFAVETLDGIRDETIRQKLEQVIANQLGIDN